MGSAIKHILLNCRLPLQEAAAREELERLAWAGDLAGLRRVATRVNCDLPDEDGRTALWWASESECDDAVKLQMLRMLAQCADVTCAGVYGNSCLHGAAVGGWADGVRALVASGAHVNDRADGDLTPLMRAARLAPAATAAAAGRALLAAGADWSLKDSRGRTALGWALAKKRWRLAASLL